MCTIMGKIAIIGCGNMGSALAQGLSAHSLVLFDRHPERMRQSGAKGIDEAVRGAEIVILAIKPKDLMTTAQAIAPHVCEETILISVLAGVTLQELRAQFSKPIVVRAMPNLAIRKGKGITGLVEDPHLSEEVRHKLNALFQPMGMVLWVPENKIDALMALTSCAPAFVAHIVEAFVDGGIHMGFPADQALPLVLSAFEGALELLRESPHPASLRWQVASPGGMTIEGLRVLEEHRVHFAIMKALEASMQKAKL